LSEKRPGKKKRGVSAAEGKPPAAHSGPMDVGLLEQIVRLMSANDLNTVDVRDGDRRVILKRGAVESRQVAYLTQPAGTSAAAPTPSKSAGGSGDSASAGSEEANFIPIKSPMVGTFYAAPAKGTKPFVAVGSAVEDETDVCIIEAMKVFNNIKAECRGSIARVMVSDGQSVEFGTVLFLVKPA
jgi:acetyl-CoA carboxylase biotin carboxyl carrier protein